MWIAVVDDEATLAANVEVNARAKGEARLGQGVETFIVGLFDEGLERIARVKRKYRMRTKRRESC